MVGTVTSGDWGHRVARNLALAFVEPGLSEIGTALDVDVLGAPVAARVIEPGPYDPAYERIRA